MKYGSKMVKTVLVYVFQCLSGHSLFSEDHCLLRCEVVYQIESYKCLGAGIAQSAWRLATGWMTERLEFESR
jgi:hypothetical protein